MVLNLQQFIAATGASADWYAPIASACERFGISTPLRQAHFLAQVGHESGGFRTLVENLNYSADGLMRTWPARFNETRAQSMARRPEVIANYVYSERMGNTNPGDGWRYRGRGLIQLTGRANYAAAADALGLPLLAEPDLVALPNAAALTAAWFWSQKGLNARADRDDLEGVTRVINGGTHGMADRLARLGRAKVALR